MRTQLPKGHSLAASHDPATKSSDAVVQNSEHCFASARPPQNKTTVIFETVICDESAEGINPLGP
jgi:hypothetical protein